MNLFVFIFIAIFGCLLFLLPLVMMGKDNAPSISLIYDTYVSSGRPDETFSNKTGLYVGHWEVNGRNKRRSLIQFSIVDSELQDAGPRAQITVNSATLTLFQRNSSLENEDLKIRAQRITGNWDSSVTWNQLQNPSQLPNVLSEPVHEFDVRWAELERVSVDLTLILQSWIDERQFETPFSVLLSATDEERENYFRAFVSKDCTDADCANLEPSLAFTYDIIPPTPTPTPTSTPTPPIALHIEMQPTPSTPVTEILPDDEINVALITSNIPSTTTNVSLISTFPSGFELVPDSASDNPIIDVTASLTQTQTITWSTPWMNSDLSVDTLNTVTREYTIKRATINQSFQPNKPPTQSRPKTNITFELMNPPSEDGYCYKWDFGDGDDSVYQLMDKRKIDYVYEDSSESPFTVTVTITEPKGENSSSDIPRFFRATATTEIEIKNPARQASAQTYKSDCGIQEGIQDIVITAQLQNDLSEPVSVSALIAPSKHTYMPIICYPCGDEE